MTRAFFDSNVLLYSASSDPRKAEVSERLVALGGHISVQVLNEVANVARRKMALPWHELTDLLDHMRSYLIVHDLILDTHRHGLALAQRHRLSVYDAMIVAAALHARCETLYSEDMHAGLVVDGRLTIVNPFV